jgi:hypothetical protein
MVLSNGFWEQLHRVNDRLLQKFIHVPEHRSRHPRENRQTPTAASVKTSVFTPDSGIEEVRQHWQDFQLQLNFYEPQSADDRAMETVDPDDVAYKKTCEELGADAVYSHDADFRAVKVPVISVPWI